jgi:hypothetical protein
MLKAKVPPLTTNTYRNLTRVLSPLISLSYLSPLYLQVKRLEAGGTPTHRGRERGRDVDDKAGDELVMSPLFCPIA